MTGSPFFFSPSAHTAEILPTPYAFWPMNEGTGAVLNDAISSLDMAITGATWAATGRNSTNCLVFADSQFAAIADPFYLEEFTICAWIYPTTLDAGKAFVTKRNAIDGTSSGGENIEFHFTMNASYIPNLLKFDSAGGTILSAAGTTALTVNTWQHIVCASKGNGETTYIYLNGGAPSGSAVQSGVTNNSTSALLIGGNTADNAARYFNGRMQEVRIYNQQLTEAEVATVYALPPP